MHTHVTLSSLQDSSGKIHIHCNAIILICYLNNNMKTTTSKSAQQHSKILTNKTSTGINPSSKIYPASK